jgi:hypothetical protein
MSCATRAQARKLSANATSHRRLKQSSGDSRGTYKVTGLVEALGRLGCVIPNDRVNKAGEQETARITYPKNRKQFEVGLKPGDDGSPASELDVDWRWVAGIAVK